jgi:hypothetical protein
MYLSLACLHSLVSAKGSSKPSWGPNWNLLILVLPNIGDAELVCVRWRPHAQPMPCVLPGVKNDSGHCSVNKNKCSNIGVANPYADGERLSMTGGASGSISITITRGFKVAVFLFPSSYVITRSGFVLRRLGRSFGCKRCEWRFQERGTIVCAVINRLRRCALCIQWPDPASIDEVELWLRATTRRQMQMTRRQQRKNI